MKLKKGIGVSSGRYDGNVHGNRDDGRRSK